LASYDWEPVDIVFDDEQSHEEPMGSKKKFWVKAPDGVFWLFKYSRVVNGETRNEDWAEWLVHRLAGLLGVPSAVIRPANCEGRRGIVSRTVLSPDGRERLVHGNELIRDFDSEYQLDTRRENPKYTVETVARALRNVGPPVGFDALATFTGFQCMAGYFVLDAWVAGRDRHHENWAAIEREGTFTLSPSFDHGNALGFQVRPEEAIRLASDEAVLERWLDRGTSHHFAQRPSLVSIARDALTAAGGSVEAYWAHQLGSIPDDEIEAVVSAVPDDLMSVESRTFVISLLKTNRRRVVDGIRNR